MPSRNLLLRKSRIALACALLFLATLSFAKPIEQVVDVAVKATDIYGKTVSQTIKVTVFRDDEKELSPFLLLNHGRPAIPAEFVKMGRVRYSDNARYFVSKGFAVFVPTRIGYGVSGGSDVEYSGSCSSRDYPPAYDAAAQQGLTVIEYARSLPYVNAERGLVVGQSFGGATAIAIAAKGIPGVLAAINFAGGGGGNPASRPADPCRPDLLEDMFATYGQTSKIPTLWLYSENDKYFGIEKPRAWFNTFVRKGGRGEFVQLPPLMPPLGEDGHSTFTRNPAAWRPAVEAFLQRTGF
jgi:dienelactone hydrolase